MSFKLILNKLLFFLAETNLNLFYLENLHLFIILKQISFREFISFEIISSENNLSLFLFHFYSPNNYYKCFA